MKKMDANLLRAPAVDAEWIALESEKPPVMRTVLFGCFVSDHFEYAVSGFLNTDGRLWNHADKATAFDRDPTHWCALPSALPRGAINSNSDGGDNALHIEDRERENNGLDHRERHIRGAGQDFCHSGGSPDWLDKELGSRESRKARVEQPGQQPPLPDAGELTPAPARGEEPLANAAAAIERMKARENETPEEWAANLAPQLVAAGEAEYAPSPSSPSAEYVLVPREPTIREREFLEGKTGTDWLIGWRALATAAPRTAQPGAILKRAQRIVDALNAGYSPDKCLTMLCEAISDAATSLSPQAGVSEWQPIETAPHGKKVLLAWRGWPHDYWVMDVGCPSWGTRTEAGSNISLHGSATHWRPLPPAPRPASKEAAE